MPMVQPLSIEGGYGRREEEYEGRNDGKPKSEWEEWMVKSLEDSILYDKETIKQPHYKYHLNHLNLL